MEKIKIIENNHCDLVNLHCIVISVQWPFGKIACFPLPVAKSYDKNMRARIVTTYEQQY